MFEFLLNMFKLVRVKRLEIEEPPTQANHAVRKIDLDTKVSIQTGKVLSDENFTTDLKTKLETLTIGGSDEPIDLSGYVVKEAGKSLISIDELNRLSTITPPDLSNYVQKDGTRVLSDRNYTVTKDNKLGGIEYNATANATNAQLRDRTTHIGEQPISSITGLQTELNKIGLSAEKVINALPTTGQPIAYRFSSGLKPTNIPSDVIFFEI